MPLVNNEHNSLRKLVSRASSLSLACISCIATGCGSNSGLPTPPAVKAPSITTQPANISVEIGQTATFGVTARGTAPLNYQWLKNGTAIEGATSSNFSFMNPQLTDSGSSLTVTISNSTGSVTSGPAKLTVTQVPVSITSQPNGGTFFIGESTTLSVAASGTSPSYQWTKNGSSISGATASSYTTSAFSSSDDNASFAVIVSNDAGSVTSSAAVIRIGPFPTAYTTQQGASMNLYAWPGKKMAILTASKAMDVPTMRKYLTAADGTYNYYADAVGQEPALNFNYNGLATIAEVQSACGAGCTYIGATGMEIVDPYFHWMPAGIPYGVYDQIMFYEMGRSFWLFPQLQFTKPEDNGCFLTGFAVLMRERSIAAQGYQGGFSPYGSYSGSNDAADAAIAASTYNSLAKNTAGLIDAYAANKSLNWSNTFLTNTYSGNGGLACTDLFASLIDRLASNYGGETFIQDLWKEVLKRPISGDTQSAIDNFILAASAAANKNLSNTFMNTWRWPMSTAAQSEAQNRWGSPI